MANVNLVVFVGRLTRDPEVRQLAGGTSVANFSIAVNRKYKDKEEVAYLDITAWSKLAEIVGKYLVKGKEVFIQGYAKLDQWKDKTTGEGRQKIGFVAERIQFLGAPKEEPVEEPVSAEGNP